jgi:hypothetical protein
MKSKMLWIGTTSFLVLLASAWAADIDGSWIAMANPFDTRGRIETIFSFRADGAKLTGTVTNSQGKTAVREGNIRGDEISFVVIRRVDGKKTKFMYKGRIAADKIEFTVKMQGGIRQPLEFTARREFQRNGDVPLLKELPPRR